MPMKKSIKIIGIVLTILLILLATYEMGSKWLITYLLSSDKVSAAVFVYNHQIYRGLWDDECKLTIEDNITQLVNDFMCDDDLTEENFFDDYEKKYGFALGRLATIKNINASDVASKAEENIVVITREHDGRINYIKAEEKYQSGAYVECLKFICQIDESYSLAESVNDLYNDTVSEIIFSVSNPNSVKEYERYISTLTTCLDITDEKQFVSRKKELEEELVIFKEVVKFIDSAEDYIDKGDFINAVKVLNEPAKKYPEEKHLALALQDCQSFLVFYAAESVNEHIANKEYKEALSLIEQAQDVYESDDLNLLYDQVKKICNPWYRFKTAVANKTESILNYFKKDVENVKQEGGVAYVYRSGEKILLGDYSKKEVSLLSVTGSGLLSVTGIDIPLDIRDFSYDVQHIGDEDNWLVWLAVDTVALLPVVGAVKYLKYADKTGKISDLASDVSKTTDKVSDAAKGVDVVSDIAKATNSIDELKDTKLGKIPDVEKEIIHYTHINTFNQKYAGKTYKGVKFESKKIELKNGTRIEGVFPKYDYSYECKLPDNMLQDTDAKQFMNCNEQLKKAIENDPSLAEKFNERQLEQINNGDKPSGFTWHHNEQEGIMQLVKTDIHSAANHTGGRYIWGGGTDAR